MLAGCLPSVLLLPLVLLLPPHVGSRFADAGTAMVDQQQQLAAAADSQLPPKSDGRAPGAKSRRSSAATSKQRLYVDGDIIVGALFPMHKEPPRGGAVHEGAGERACGEIWEQYGIHRVETFLRTLDRINEDTHILPGVTLGCDVRDSCWDVQTSLGECKHYIRTSLVRELDYSPALASDEAGSNGGRCGFAGSSGGSGFASKPIAVLIGAGSSQVSMQVQDMLQLFSIPQLDYAATSADLSDKSRYRYFLRVAPPDSQQASALADLVEHFGWTYISTVYTDGMYGSSGMDVFSKMIRSRGICVATADHVSGVDNDERYDEVIRNLQKTSEAKVIVCFCEGGTVNGLLRAMKRLNDPSGFFIVSSDGWNTRTDVVKDVHDYALGSFSIKMDSPQVPWFDEYFFSLTPQNNTRNPWFRDFWEFRFGCDLPTSNGSTLSSPKYNRTCSGTENLRQGYDVDAKLGFVVNAMYAMAHGLDAMQRDVCGSNNGPLCEAMVPLNGSLLLQHLKRVNFTTFNDQILFFNENGDPPGKYLYMNYQLVDGEYVYKPVGSWQAGVFSVNSSSVQWRPTFADKSENQSSAAGAIPESVCSHPCAHGFVKKAQPQLTRCCWVCQKCPDNAILPGNETCKGCGEGWWPDINLTECVELPIKHIQWSDVDAALPLTLACIGVALTAATMAVFAQHNRTAVVKASTRELSYLMLAGIALAHISTLAFFAKPTAASCYASRILPGLSFSVVYGAVLTKTNRIARILSRSKRIALDKPRCMTTGSLLIVTAGLVSVEAAISAAMLTWQPAEAKVVYPDGGRTALLVCNTTPYGVLAPLGFDFLLIVLCTFYAVKTRNVPANFNEAKYIGFAMYTTCVIWVGFVAIYFGSDSKVLTIALSVTLSATVTLLLLFGQKIYIILWKPEKNRRSAFTTTTKDVRCHIGSAAAAASAIECSARLITPTCPAPPHPNGMLRRNTSSGSLSSSSSRLIAIQQKAPRGSQKPPAGAPHLPVKARKSNQSSATAAFGASAPDPASLPLQPLSRGTVGPSLGEEGVAAAMPCLGHQHRSVACQTGEHADEPSSLADGGGPLGQASTRLCSQSARGDFAGSAFGSIRETGGCSELASVGVEAASRQPLLVHLASSGDATLCSEGTKLAVLRPLGSLSEKGSSADAMADRSQVTNGGTGRVGSSECVHSHQSRDLVSLCHVANVLAHASDPIANAEACPAPAEASAGASCSSSWPQRSAQTWPLNGRQPVAPMVPMTQSKSWASDVCDGGTLLRASEAASSCSNNNVAPQQLRKEDSAFFAGQSPHNEPAGV